jgi:DNA-binding transcriptional regulator PaaX
MINEIKETLTDLLVALLLSGRNPVSFRKILRERELARYKKESIRVALSRFNKKGFLENSKQGWEITTKGKIYFGKIQLFSYIPSPFERNISSSILFSFDIPGPERRKRDWLRNQLKIFGYKMLQQSLWLGPGPLPNEFIDRLKELEIKKNIRMFKIKMK